MSSKDEIQILVVDDDPALLDLITLRFNKMGLKVDQAEDGRYAQKLIERKAYDLIVADIYVPGATGLALLRKAKEKDPHVQVIVITAGATLDNAIEALNNGAFAYLTKPFDHISVFDNVASRALEYRRLLLDNLRMAETQRRRGDMLEDEVTQRVHQLRQRQRDLLDLLGALPDGVIVVERGGRVMLSSPVAEKWLARELRSGGQPIQRFLETVHDEWAEDVVEVEVGPHVLRLTATDLPSEDDKKRKVVIIREVENSPAEVNSQLGDPLAHIKRGLAWLYGKKMGVEISEVLKHLAFQVSELERLGGISAGANGRSQRSQPDEPGVESSEVEVGSSGHDQGATADEQRGDEPALEPVTPLKKTSHSGLLHKHLHKTTAKDLPMEATPEAEGGVDDQLNVIDSDEALETMQGILDRGVTGDDGLQELVAASEESIEGSVDEELREDGGDDHPHTDPILRDAGSLFPLKRSRSSASKWPPARPSEMDDFDEY